MTAAKQADYTLTICPFQQGNPDKLPNINAGTELQHAWDLTKYFHPTGLIQMWSLNGQIFIESQLTSKMLEHLNTWYKNSNHCVSPLQYQTEETSQLGFLPCSYVSIHAQQLHLKMSSPKDPKREKGWKYSSMRYVLHIGINMWRWQNDVVHGENENKKQAKKQIPKATRIHKDTHQLQAWL